MSAGLFIGAGLILCGSAALMGLALSFFWNDKDTRRAHRLLTAVYYLGWPLISIGFLLLLIRIGGAA
jgi:hypothetical protein